MSGARPGDDGDRAARVALTCLAEPGNRAMWEMVQEHGAEATLARVLVRDIEDAALLGTVNARSGGLKDPRSTAELAIRRGDRFGARVVVPADAEWPAGVESLATLELDGRDRIHHDVRPPLCLWVRGEHPVGPALQRSVAIVGARAATPYGTHVTAEFAYGLAEQGWTVLSGGAFGIDAAAHRAVLSGNGVTVAVLACGVDRPYPMGNAAMFDRIAETGLLMSEWPLGADPLRHRFLIRNRVIAAATRGTVVVEAAARSGATQTMGRVVALNRPAMVVPGPVTSAMSVGCHELLRTCPGTRVVTSVAHILDEVGPIGEHPAEPARARSHPRDNLDEQSALVLEAVPHRTTTDPDQLAARAGVDLRTVLRRLSLLEQLGLVERRDGGFALTRAARTNVSRKTAPRPGELSVGITRDPGTGATPRASVDAAPRASGDAEVAPRASADAAPRASADAAPRASAEGRAGAGGDRQLTLPYAPSSAAQMRPHVSSGERQPTGEDQTPPAASGGGA